MQTVAEYLDKTESAMRKLFEGIDSYLEPLRRSDSLYFVSSVVDDEERRVQRETWLNQNKSAITVSYQAQREFIAESFAQATLCGAALQIAAKALECYSRNNRVPSEWSSVEGLKTKAAAFCCGRLIRGVPLGLVIYAGRNQHIHFNDKALREPNFSVFDRLATNHGFASETPCRDPDFDLANNRLVSFASNITELIGWRTYDAYAQDIRKLLGI